MNEHTGPVFAVPQRRKFSYQDERTLIRGEWVLVASDPTHLDTHTYRDQSSCRSYELRIENHTGTCITADLKIIPSPNEKSEGKKPYTLEWSGSFAEFCNRLFGPAAERYDE